VGGGVFGAVTAFELARAGLGVTLVDRDPPGAHASGRNPANLNPILGTPPELLPLALASFRLHAELQASLAEVGCGDYRLADVRRVLVWCDEAERGALDAVAAAFAGQHGFASSRLDGRDLALLEPRVAGAARGGVLLDGNRSLDAAAFNRALLEAVARHGGRLLRAAVRRIEPRSGGFRVSVADAATIDCRTVVLATGPWVAECREWLAVDLPVRPVRGQMARVTLPGGPLHVDVTHGPISLYRRGAEATWVGATREEAGFDERPTAHGLQSLLDTAAKFVPVVREATVVDHMAALRPTTPDGLPLIGPVPGHEGVYVANGGGGKGMLLCAAAGRAIRDLVVDGGTSLPIGARVGERVA